MNHNTFLWWKLLWLFSQWMWNEMQLKKNIKITYVSMFLPNYKKNPYIQRSGFKHEFMNLWPITLKRALMEIAKSIDPGQPAQSVRADRGQNFSLLADFLCINPLLHRYSFWRINTTAFENIMEKMWEKEKLLVTSNFSFPHNVFNSIK